MIFFRDFFVLIASAVIVLAWRTVTLTEERRKSEDRRFVRFSDFAGLLLQRCSPAHLTVPLLMEALDNAW